MYSQKFLGINTLWVISSRQWLHVTAVMKTAAVCAALRETENAPLTVLEAGQRLFCHRVPKDAEAATQG